MIRNNLRMVIAMLEAYNFLLFVAVLLVIASKMSNKKLMRAFYDLKAAIKEVSKGNYSVRVQYEPKDELAGVIDGFNQMAVELNRIKTMQLDFVNMFSHECNTPLNSIVGFAKQLKREDISVEKREEYLDIIISEASHLAHMSKNMLTLSRCNNEQFLTDLDWFSLDEQIRICILMFEKDWSKKNIHLEIEMEEVLFYGSEDYLKHVWINLLSNAIKFSNDYGKIEVHLKRELSHVCVIIRDYGIGMKEETKNHIFDMFYTSSEKEYRGNGIGLPIVQRIVQLHQGETYVNSKERAGTTFEIHLPLFKKMEEHNVIKDGRNVSARG